MVIQGDPLCAGRRIKRLEVWLSHRAERLAQRGNREFRINRQELLHASFAPAALTQVRVSSG